MLLSFMLLVSLLSCDPTRKIANSQTARSAQLEQLLDLMTGTFTSSAQASADSAFFDISLVMWPIWEQDASAKWLYVEQALSARARQPYRQRVYRVQALPDGRFESRVYELPDPAAYVHAWEDPARFSTLREDDLILRAGCAVYLSYQDNGCFTGATKPNTCTSTLYGASYATSEVSICPGQIISWDRGWDASGKQVWGAEKGGYVFLKQP